MKVKILERNGPRGHAIGHGGQCFYEDDVVTVDDATGKLFCEMGWAEDVDGNVPTGQRDTTPKRLQPANVVHEVKAG